MAKAFGRLGMKQCPICHEHSLVLMEYDCDVWSLNELGEKEEFVEMLSDYQPTLVCSKCFASFPADKRGNAWFIVDEFPIPRNNDLLGFNPFQKVGE